MQFVVVRHAKAVPGEGWKSTDLKRPITGEGEKEAMRLGQALDALPGRVGLAFISDAMRSFETSCLAVPRSTLLVRPRLRNMESREVYEKLRPLCEALQAGKSLADFKDHPEFPLWQRQGQYVANDIEATSAKFDAQLVLVVGHGHLINMVAWALEGQHTNSPCLGPCPAYGTGFLISYGGEGWSETRIFPGS
ncbi:MAG: hypothetical protein A2842_01115 [Candidatus Wildermuthbacteria bacterium RIFCSPHIGHO2_01_FULL_48_25]|nr:MAG: hypothetical protein A2842_01115 [Candidatus Wildermuthbacteria bacterium RIFCSPHIGHO2_01_FULL_48_25]OHA69426.1 MAG: hypothetical protein A3J57_02730 [Candidatus Wildermuthbacteria bacterium RIFCSPHIGHO2_02_FULL_49_12b]